MVNNIKYTNIRVILDDLLQNDLLQDITLEQVVGYVIKFNGLLNIPQLYIEKDAYVDIEDYRGPLPCDLVSVKQVRDCSLNIALREISGTFHNPHSVERAFKTQGSVIFTTFKKGKVEIVYRAIPTDEEGYPLIMDDERYKEALEFYIKKERFTRFFEMGQIALNVLQHAEQEYCWAVAKLHTALKMPSLSEWESISNAHNQLLVKGSEFRKGFETTGLPEYFKKH